MFKSFMDFSGFKSAPIEIKIISNEKYKYEKRNEKFDNLQKNIKFFIINLS